MVLSYIAGPVIGAIIGYCTNYIAVKMLFYPRKEVRVFGHRLPFTPGVIPKGKDRLAIAAGSVVGDKLLTSSDIEKNLVSDDLANVVTEELCNIAKAPLKAGLIEMTGMSEGDYEDKKNQLAGNISDMAVNAIGEMDLTSLVVERGTAMIQESFKDTMLAMFLDETMLAGILGPMAENLQAVAVEEKDTYITPVIYNKVTELEEQNGIDVMNAAGLDEAFIRSIVAAVVPDLMRSSLSGVLDQLNINKIVEDKIRAMSVEELERVVLAVMKKELNTIVNLGALIGLIIGTLTIFF